MIKRKQTIKTEDIKNALFNLAGFAVIGGVGCYMVYAAVTTEEIVRCSERYAAVSELSLHSVDGQHLTPIEFQAGLNDEAENILTNAEIVPVSQGDIATALKVRFSEKSIENGSEISGVKFRWAPSRLERSESGCLAYNVLLPENFDFSRKGKLPSFHGVGKSANEDGVAKPFEFVAQVGWVADGKARVSVVREGDADIKEIFPAVWTSKKPLPTGNWLRIEQEFVANSPNAADGIYRMWVDGKLAIEDKLVGWAPKGTAKFSGVTGSIGYELSSSAKSSSEQQVVHVTPFRLQWQ